MKKSLIIFILLLLCLCGCNTNLNNTPTKQAEIFLGKYQTLHKDVMDDLDSVVAEEEAFNTEQRNEYKSIMKRHYQELEYIIKDEKIDGDKAIVTVEIEVKDYTKIQDALNQELIDNPDKFKDDNGQYNPDKYINYRLEQMKNNKDTVKYTLELSFSKVDKLWVIDKLDNDEMQKINGIYNY